MSKDIILYHGSKEIVEFPEIRIQKYNKDFYFGFYCTLFPEQAMRWATRYDGAGYLNEYQYVPDDTLNVKTFTEMSEEWLDFIVNCRMEKSAEQHFGSLQSLKDRRIRLVFIQQKL